MKNEIKKLIDIQIEKIGLEATLSKTYEMLKESLSTKDYLIINNKELKNIPSHIEMAYEIIDYVKSEIRDHKISILINQ
jgi:hypothetical protein